MPPEYAAELAQRIGLYHTIGMPEETWSLNEERISDKAFLEMVDTILKENEAMLFDTLGRDDSELVVTVFVQPDRVSHMFWRGIDPQHPLHDQTDEVARSAIRWIYGESDRILGRVLEVMKPEDRLIVLSDHGFDSFRRAVHLNRWLADEGYLALKPGAPSSESLFTNVDWTKSKAFALGLNGIFLNLSGREALGIVRPEDVAALKQEISDKLKAWRDPDTGETVVLNVSDGSEIYHGKKTADAPDLVVGYSHGYRASWQTALGGVPDLLVEDNTRKWSGDHCIEPSLVPGVLFTSFKPPREVASIIEIPSLIRERSVSPAPSIKPRSHRRGARSTWLRPSSRGSTVSCPDCRTWADSSSGGSSRPSRRWGSTASPRTSRGLPQTRRRAPHCRRNSPTSTARFPS